MTKGLDRTERSIGKFSPRFPYRRLCGSGLFLCRIWCDFVQSACGWRKLTRDVAYNLAAVYDFVRSVVDSSVVHSAIRNAGPQLRPTVSVYSACLQCLFTVSVYSACLQCLFTVPTYSTCLQCSPKGRVLCSQESQRPRI